jgi:hypothetical protein
MATFHRIAIPLFEELQAARKLGILLVVEIIDILDISVESIEETCKPNTIAPVRRVLNGPNDKALELTGQIGLLARLDLLSSRLDKLLQGLVLDIRGAPLGNGKLRQIAAELHVGGSRTSDPMLSTNPLFLFPPSCICNIPIPPTVFNRRVSRGDQPESWEVIR